MKRIKYLIFMFVVMFMGGIVVNAAPSYSFSTSTSSVENGKKVTATVTLKNVAAWNVRITSSGNTNGCSQSFADATGNGGNTTKTLSVTCKATSLGAIGFTLSGDVTSSDGANISVSGNKRVSVVEPRPLSQNNYLASITVGDYELTPTFDEEVSEYSVTVPSTVNEVKIDAKAKDRYASLTGTGTFEVVEGSNSFKIVVTAENGATKEYTVNVIVEDLNPIVIKINGQDYTIVKNIKNITAPELFTASETTIGDTTVPAFVSDVSDFVLVALKDSEGKSFFAIKDGDNYILYRTITIGNLILFMMDKDCPFEYFEKETITVGDYEIDAYHSINSSDYYLIYGINMATGNEEWYKYDTKESTLQRYENNTEIELKKDLKQYFIVILIFGGSLILAVVIALLSVIIANKKVKKAKALINKNKIEKVEKQPKIEKKLEKEEEKKEEKKKEIKKASQEDLQKTVKIEKNNENKGSKKK